MNFEKKLLIFVGIATLIFIIAGALFFSREKEEQNDQTIDQAQLIASAKHNKGNPDAAVKIVEFADFQCPACKTAFPIVKDIVEKNEQRVFYVYRHFPLTFHKNSKVAAQACEAAGEQQKFLEMHDRLYETQESWADSGNARDIFENYAKDLGLDIEKFREDFEASEKIVELDYSEGNRFGIQSTPTFFINGKKYPGVISGSELQSIITNTN